MTALRVILIEPWVTVGNLSLTVILLCSDFIAGCERSCLHWSDGETSSLSYAHIWIFSFFVLQIVLHQLVNILKQTEKVVATLTDVELPEWKRRQQLACIGSQADTSLDHLDKWLELICSAHLCMSKRICFSSDFLHSALVPVLFCVQVFDCRRSAARSLRTAEETSRPEQQIQQHWPCLLPLYFNPRNGEIWAVLVNKTSHKVSHSFFYMYRHTHTDAPTVWIVTCSVVVWHCSALVVEKQPVMQKFPQRPLILKTGVQFSITVR